MSSNYNSNRVWPEMNARHEEIFADSARTYVHACTRRGGIEEEQETAVSEIRHVRFFSLSFLFLIFWMNEISTRIFPIHIQAKLDSYLYHVLPTVSLIIIFRSLLIFLLFQISFISRDEGSIEKLSISTLENWKFSHFLKSIFNGEIKIQSPFSKVALNVKYLPRFHGV